MTEAVTQLVCNNFGGIKTKNAIFSADIITAQDMQNVELFYSGTNGGVGIRTAKGNLSICDTLKNQEKIINIFESVQNGTTYMFVHTETSTIGKFYLYNGETLTLKKTNLTLTGNSNGFDVAQGWSDLFFFTNGVEMFTIELNYQTTGNQEIVTFDSVVDKDNRQVVGLGACLFQGRLWIFKNNILWYSMVADIYDFSTSDEEWITSAGYIETLKNITAIHEYLNSLAIFYADSSELLSISNGALSRSNESPGGCAGVNALVFHDTNLYFYDDTKKAVFSFAQIVTGEKALGENVATEIQDLLSEIDYTQLNKIKTVSVFIEDRNEIWWLIPTTDENYSTVLIFDYLKNAWIKRKEQKINSIRVIGNYLYSAGNDGTILREYTGKDFNGKFIQHYYNCSPLNLGSMNTLKVFMFPPRVWLGNSDTNKFYVKYTKDFNIFRTPKTKLIKTKYKNILEWNDDKTSWNESYWLTKNSKATGKFPSASFKVLEISIYTDSLEQDFCIKNLEFSKIKVKQV